MKQLIFTAAMMVYFSLRSFWDPVYAVLLYYILAVLRPQYIWSWAMGMYGEIRWSFYAACVAVAACLLHAAGLGRRAVQTSFLVLIVVFGLLLTGSYFAAMNKVVAAVAGWEYAKIFIMLLVASFVITQPKHMRYLGYVIFVCLIYIIYDVNSKYVFEGRMDIWVNGYGGMDNNGAAMMMAMVIPFCFYYFQAEKRWWRWGFLICLLPAAHAVMLTFSRGAMLSSIIGGLGMVLTNRKHRFKVLAMAAIMGVLVMAMAGKEVQKRFMSIEQKDTDSSAQSRFGSWEAGYLIAKDYPLFGCGLRNANLLTKEYGADVEGRTIHDVYIQIAADSGFPAAATFILMLLSAFTWFRRSAKTTEGNLEDDEVRWHYYTSKACFWSLFIFSFATIFLSMEVFELAYLLMLLGAASPALAQRCMDNAKARASKKPAVAQPRPTKPVVTTA